MPKLTLISLAICPFVQRAIIALKEKGVEHELVYVDLDDRPDWFVAISPLGKVPILRVEQEGRPDVHIFESSVIVEFLEETVPGRALHPTDAVERAHHRSWMEFASQCIGDSVRLFRSKDDGERETASAALRAKLERLETEVKGPFFAGEVFSLVDAAFAPLFRSLAVAKSGDESTRYAGLAAIERWRAALADRQCVREAISDDYAVRLHRWIEGS